MRRSLLITLLCLIAPAYAQDTVPDCSVDRDAVMALDEAGFDQALPDGGWRRLDTPGCHLAAAELIAAWRASHPQASPTVAWHQGQMLAQGGRNADAIPLLEHSRKPVEQDVAGRYHGSRPNAAAAVTASEGASCKPCSTNWCVRCRAAARRRRRCTWRCARWWWPATWPAA